MKRLVTIVLGISLVVAVLFLPAVLYGVNLEDEVSEPTTITSYVADFDIDDEGDLTAVETITVDFPVSDRHGIFRFFDKSDDSAPNARRVPHDIEVTMDGEDVPVDVQSAERGRYVLAKIGDPDVYVSTGEHVYEISYQIDGVLEEGTDGTETQFYWNLIPGGWLQEIEKSKLTVHLPVAAEDVQCAIGDGGDGSCEARGDGTTTLRVRTGALPAQTPVTVKVGLDMPTPPAGKTLPWTARFDPVFGSSLLLLGLVLMLSLAAGAFGFVLAKRAREANPQFPLMYAPPEGIGPAQAAYLVTETIDSEQYVATLMYAAEKGAIDLDRADDAWTITDKNGAEGWAGLDPVTSGVAHLLGGPGTSFTAAPSDVEAGKRLKTEISDFEDNTKLWAFNSKLMVNSGLGGFGTAGDRRQLRARPRHRDLEPARHELPRPDPRPVRAVRRRPGDHRLRHQAHPSRPRRVVEGRRLQADPVDPVGRGALRLLRPPGALHGVRPVGGRLRLRRRVGRRSTAPRWAASRPSRRTSATPTPARTSAPPSRRWSATSSRPSAPPSRRTKPPRSPRPPVGAADSPAVVEAAAVAAAPGDTLPLTSSTN